MIKGRRRTPARCRLSSARTSAARRRPRSRASRARPETRQAKALKALRSRLREAEYRLVLALEWAEAGTWTHDFLRNTTMWDARVARLYGFDDSVAPSLDAWLARVHESDRPYVCGRIGHLESSAENHWEIEFRAFHTNGSVMWIRALGQAERDAAGRLIRLTGINVDITARKQAEASWHESEETLHESEARLRTLVDNARHWLWDWDIVTGEHHLADRWYMIEGYATAEEAPTYDFFANMHPDDRERVLSALRRHLESDAFRYDVDYRARTKGGEWAWINTQGRVYKRDAEGRPLRMMGTIHDITDRKREEAEHQRLEAQLRHAQRLESLGVLAGGIAHDFNNLLTGILCNAALVLDELPTEAPAREPLDIIVTAARRAAALTEQMLAYGGQGQSAKEVIRIDTLVREMLALLSTAVAKKTDLRLQLEPALVEGDPAQIQQVVMNLITNAAEAVGDESGVVRVRTSVRDFLKDELRSRVLPDHADGGRFVCIEVEDSGHGMDGETLSRIFDPFFTTKLSGRGLGLAAVMGIVRGHGGTLTVDTTPGVGSLFRVFLPATLTSPNELTASPPPRPRQGTGTILVIDDEDVVRHSLRRALERAGFDVLVAGDGGDGLTVFNLHADRIVAAVVDLTMPVLDGTVVLARLRRRAPLLPVIVMSGFRPAAYSRHAEDGGPTLFLKKPTDPDALVSQLEALLAPVDA